MRSVLVRLSCLAFAATAFFSGPIHAQEKWPPISSAAEQSLATLAKHPPVAKALSAIRGDGVRMFEEQVRLNEIPAPPFKEATRAQYYLKKLREAGLSDARIDGEGNVIGVRPGSGRGPRLVISAHLDTVFPEGTDVKVREKGGRFYGPGIADDAAGLTSLLTMAEHLNKSGVRTVGDIIVVGTVGEEELGDLRGVKALFRDDRDIDGFISLDGVGLGRIVNQATGSHRFFVEFKGPGGHSFSAFGLPSAIHAMGRAIAKIGDLKPPAEPKTTFTVGTVKGGTSVNAIAGDATMAVDIRSNGQEELLKFEESVIAAIRQSVDDENRRWNSKAISVEVKLVGDRPAGMTPVDSPIVHAARAALRAIGAETRAITAASTDSNLPMNLGIPAITLSSAGQSGGAHSLGEWYSPVNNWLGPQLALLVSLGLVGVDGVAEPLLEKRTKK
jgi:acetylornithine deacetylase/succinyl-diaminopimelate desuccinylase-like protein